MKEEHIWTSSLSFFFVRECGGTEESCFAKISKRKLLDPNNTLINVTLGELANKPCM